MLRKKADTAAHAAVGQCHRLRMTTKIRMESMAMVPVTAMP